MAPMGGMRRVEGARTARGRRKRLAVQRAVTCACGLWAQLCKRAQRGAELRGPRRARRRGARLDTCAQRRRGEEREHGGREENLRPKAGNGGGRGSQAGVAARAGAVGFAIADWSEEFTPIAITDWSEEFTPIAITDWSEEEVLMGTLST